MYRDKKQIALTFPNELGQYLDSDCPGFDFYTSKIRKWANGSRGCITSFEDKDNSWRKDFPDYEERDELRFVEFNTAVWGIDVSREEFVKFPIVAAGIIGYWIKQWNQNKRNISDIFNSYYDRKLNEYINRQQCHRIDAWDKKEIENEFVSKVHLKEELANIEISQAIMPYLVKKDQDCINQLVEEYLKWLKKIKRFGVVKIGNNQKPKNSQTNSTKKGKGRPSKNFKDFIKPDAPSCILEVLKEMLNGLTGKSAALIIKACVGWWINKPESKCVTDFFESVKYTAFNNAMKNESLFSKEDIEAKRKEIETKIMEKQRTNNL